MKIIDFGNGREIYFINEECDLCETDVECFIFDISAPQGKPISVCKECLGKLVERYKIISMNERDYDKAKRI